MTMPPPPPATTLPPAGWYTDPSGDLGQRYWDGQAWTTWTQPGDAWQPTQPAGTRRGYRRLSTWLQALVGLTALLSLAIVWAGVDAARMVDPVASGAVPFEDLVAAEGVLGVLILLELATFVVAGIVWILWLYRSHRQAASARDGDYRHTPGWAIGSWFVPFANLWIPKQMHDDIWVRASPSGLGRQGKGLLNWWWFLFLASRVVDIAVAAVLPPEVFPAPGWSAYYASSAWGGAYDVVLAVVALLVVRGLSQRVDQASAAANLR